MLSIARSEILNCDRQSDIMKLLYTSYHIPETHIIIKCEHQNRLNNIIVYYVTVKLTTLWQCVDVSHAIIIIVCDNDESRCGCHWKLPLLKTKITSSRLQKSNQCETGVSWKFLALLAHNTYDVVSINAMSRVCLIKYCLWRVIATHTHARV